MTPTSDRTPHPASTGGTSRWTRWVALLVLAGFGAYLGVVIQARLDAVEAARADATPADTGPRAVATTAVASKVLVAPRRVTGALAPASVVAVVPKLGGEVTEVLVEEGDVVIEGQLLATLDDEDLGWQHALAKAQHAAAKAGIGQAQAALDGAKTALKRVRRLANSGAVPQAQLDDAKAGHAQAKAAVDAAKAQAGVAEAGVGRAAAALENVKLEAPMAGTVTRRTLEVGALAAPTSPEPAFLLEDLARLQVVAHVDADVWGVLPVGTTVGFVADDLPGRRFEAKVAFRAPTLDPATRKAKLELDVQGDDAARAGLLANMFVRLQVVVGDATARPSVPASAVVRDGSGARVFAVRGDTAVALPVPEGAAERGGWVAAPAGLQLGDQVVVEGQHTLEDGVEVRVTPSAKGAAEEPAR